LDIIGTRVFLLALFTVTSNNGFYSPSPPPPPPPPSKTGLKLVCNVNIVFRNLKSENSEDDSQKPQRNCTFMNSASGRILMTRPAMHDFRDDGWLCTFTYKPRAETVGSWYGRGYGPPPSHYKFRLLSHCPAASVPDPDSLIPDTDPAFKFKYQSGSESDPDPGF
jgi:hypothetical protein